MQSLWIYPENAEVLEIACKSLLKALKPRYQKIALFSPIDGVREGFWERYGLNSLEFYGAIDKQKALELVSTAQEELLFETMHRLNAMGAVGLILLGDKEAINSQAKNLNLNLENVEIIDPNTSHYKEEFANHLYELRKSKGLSEQEAKQLVLDKTYFATMLVHSGYAHAMVSGVNHS
ncbi:hypothetical protein JT241_04530 [Helicobacter pylori]|nr:hypothetical protein [Helicobacter pylori]